MLTRWGVIDIEATGLDPASDEIIEIGFLIFEGKKLVEKFSSLVKPKNHQEISPFVTSLTGISSGMLRDAPFLEDLHSKLSVLENTCLIAHNASFEESFLKALPFKLTFVDSLPFIGMCNITKSTLGLESLIIKYGLATFENHRGFQDALDLLKVLILSWNQILVDGDDDIYKDCFNKYLADYFFTQFIKYTKSDLLEISLQIEFDYPVEKDTVYTLPSVDFTKESIESSSLDADTKELCYRLAVSLKTGTHSLIEVSNTCSKDYLSIVAAFAKVHPILIVSRNFNRDLFFKIDNLKVSRLIAPTNCLCVLDFENLETNDLSFSQAIAYCHLGIILRINSKYDYNKQIASSDIPVVLIKNNEELENIINKLLVKDKCNDCLRTDCTYRKNCNGELLIGSFESLFSFLPNRPKYIIVEDAEYLEDSASRLNGFRVSFKSLDSVTFSDLTISRNFKILLLQLKKEIDAIFEPSSYWQERPLLNSNIIETIKQMNELIPSLGLKVLISTSDASVRVIRWHAEHSFVLESIPIDIGKIMHQKVLSVSSSVNFIGCNYIENSKTTAEWMTGYSYLDSHRYKDAFKFKKEQSTKIYLSHDGPAINDPLVVATCLSHVLPLFNDKKVVVLFSSYSRFEMACNYLKDKKLPLFVAGSSKKVLEDFNKSSSGILVANDISNMTGIDLLVMDKIPDHRMNIIHEKRKDFFDKTFGDAFTHFNLAYRSRMIQQKIEKTMPNAVIIFDSRVKKWQNKSLNNFIELIKPHSLEIIAIKDIDSHL